MVAFGTSTPTSITVVLMSALVSPAPKPLHDRLLFRRRESARATSRNETAAIVPAKASNSAAAAFTSSFSLSSING